MKDLPIRTIGISAGIGALIGIAAGLALANTTNFDEYLVTTAKQLTRQEHNQDGYDVVSVRYVDDVDE